MCDTLIRGVTIIKLLWSYSEVDLRNVQSHFEVAIDESGFGQVVTSKKKLLPINTLSTGKH